MLSFPWWFGNAAFFHFERVTPPSIEYLHYHCLINLHWKTWSLILLSSLPSSSTCLILLMVDGIGDLRRRFVDLSPFFPSLFSSSPSPLTPQSSLVVVPAPVPSSLVSIIRKTIFPIRKVEKNVIKNTITSSTHRKPTTACLPLMTPCHIHTRPPVSFPLPLSIVGVTFHPW